MKAETQLKLEESSFFLKKMEENVDLDPDFDFYFNAFISSGRSVTFVMKKEYSKIEGFKNWYEEKVLNEKENKILKKLTIDLRNTSIHLKSLKTHLEYVFDIPVILDMNPDQEYRIVYKKVKKWKLRKKRNIIKYDDDDGTPFGFTGKVQYIRVFNPAEEQGSSDDEELDNNLKTKKRENQLNSLPNREKNLILQTMYFIFVMNTTIG